MSNTKVIELTSKRLKGQILLWSILFWGSFGFVFIGEDENQIAIASLLGFLSLIMYLVTKFRIWWNHE